MLKFSIDRTEVEELGFAGTTKDLYAEVSMMIGMVYSALEDEQAEDFKQSLIKLIQNDTFWRLAKKLDMKSRGLVSESFPIEDREVVFGDADNEKAF